MNSAFRWEPAMEEYEDDPDFVGVKYYELPNGQHIRPRNKFWHTRERFIFTIEDVKTKVYKGVVGPKGDTAGDYVFYDTDYTEVRHVPQTDYAEIDKIPVSAFADLLDADKLVGHRGNKLKRPP